MSGFNDDYQPDNDDSFFGLDLDLDGDVDDFDDFLGLAILHRLARREGAFGPERGVRWAGPKEAGCLGLILLLAALLSVSLLWWAGDCGIGGPCRVDGSP